MSGEISVTRTFLNPVVGVNDFGAPIREDFLIPAAVLAIMGIGLFLHCFCPSKADHSDWPSLKDIQPTKEERCVERWQSHVGHNDGYAMRAACGIGMDV